MSIVYEPHVCVKPRENRRVGRFALVPIYDRGTIWRCGDCTRYWRYVAVSMGDYGKWRRVRFWNLFTKHRIRKVSQ